MWGPPHVQHGPPGRPRPLEPFPTFWDSSDGIFSFDCRSSSSPCFLTDCGQAYEVPIHMCDTAIPRSRFVPSRTPCHLIDVRAHVVHVVSRRTPCVAVPNCMNAKASILGVFVHFPCADFAVQDLVKSVIIVDILLLGYQRLHGFREVGRYYLHELCLKSFIVQTKVRVLLQF